MKKFFLFFVFLGFVFPFPVGADQLPREETITGKVVEVTLSGEEKDLTVQVVKEKNEGELINLSLTNDPLFSRDEVKKGDLFLIASSADGSGRVVYYIVDRIRHQPLYSLFFFFLVLAVVVGGWRGAGSVVSLFVSFFLIVFFLVPRISEGGNPIFWTVLMFIFLVPFTFYLSHGFGRKTTVAIFGTIISLFLASFFAQGAIEAAHLTGLVSEEIGFLSSVRPGEFNFRGLLLAGMIIALLGVLDDITVSQAAVVEQLKKTGKLSSHELFSRAMKIGKDHIASMVNTLVLVYAGASLPLLLLFYQSPRPFLEVVNYEIIAEEIVRALVGSIALIIAVPVTTLLAVLGKDK